MVLVDTSVWVSHLRRGEPRLEALLDDAQVVSHPFVIGELACGNMKNRREVLSLLHALPVAPVVDEPEFLHFLDRHSLTGLGLGFVDVHLLASAQLAGVPLWTADGLLMRSAERLRLGYSR